MTHPQGMWQSPTIDAVCRQPAAPAERTAARQDIQVLRGIAVLAVLLYHSGLMPLKAGYLGVDIFFVISGYLITKNILTDIAARSFSFADFYARRARRLLPAAYCTLFVTTLLASRTLTADRWDDFIAQLLGAITFTANFVLPLQTGYFETSAASKALLHTWSLSVEEQYYLLAPLLLVAIRPRWRLATFSVLALLSFALCVALVSSRLSYWRFPEVDSRQLAFFMLPTRAWEMLAGTLLACLAAANVVANPPPPIKWLALGLLCALCAFPWDSVHPRGDALGVVLLTAILVAGEGGWIGNRLPVRILGRIGDWSYSLYLVHWPLFALSNCVFLGLAPVEVRGALVVLSILLACLQYKYVEQRFRHAPTRANHWFAWMAMTSVAVALLPFALGAVRPPAAQAAYAYLHESNQGLSARCAAGGGVNDAGACSTSSNPRIAVWGDSYAMHLIPGLLKIKPVAESMIQITKAACAPVRGVASIDENYDDIWAKDCLHFNERAFDLISSTDSIRYVIISSPFSGYLDPGQLKVFRRGRTEIADRSSVLENLVSTVSDLQARGKRPILVAPPPRPGFDIGACREQIGMGLVVLGRSSCDFQQATSVHRHQGIIDGLQEVQRRTGAPVIWLDNMICAGATCRTATPDGASVYKDGGHLSIPGSRWLVPKLGIERLTLD